MSIEEANNVVSDLYRQWRENRIMARKAKFCVFANSKFCIADGASLTFIRVNTLDEAVSYML